VQLVQHLSFEFTDLPYIEKLGRKIESDEILFIIDEMARLYVKQRPMVYLSFDSDVGVNANFNSGEPNECLVAFTIPFRFIRMHISSIPELRDEYNTEATKRLEEIVEARIAVAKTT
jgi:hypothetical protein